ncbi:hypothetical protein U9M48_043744, partial [Paspalum notatum var. saurae]
VIALVPKVQEADELIKIFRTNEVVSPTQTAFIKGRIILERVVWWPFLFQTLRIKDFSSKWISWIGTFIPDGSVAINPAKLDEQFEGVIPHLVDGGLWILRYADDTILFMDHDLDKAQNMKLLLFAFEQSSGLKINFHERELFCFRAAQEKKLRNCDWVKVEERFEKRLSSWKGKHLSIGGRLTLINLVLSSLSTYMMSFFSVPKGMFNKLDNFHSRPFFGREMKARRNTGLQNNQGGLGILDLNTKNSVLLSKWLYKLLTSDGMWQQILCNKYIGKARFSMLWNLSRKERITKAINNNNKSISWRRKLYGTNLDDWNSFLSCLEGLDLSQGQDAFYWNLTPKFSVKSHYAALMLSNSPNVNSDLWKLKAPMKIKILLWYLQKGVIFTKDNLAKRNWHGSLTCVSCHKEETINHLFFECRLARLDWSILQMATGINPPQ